MIFTEITFKSWAADQTSEIGAALAETPGRPISHNVDFGIHLFHPGWAASLARRLCLEGLQAEIVETTDARSEVVVEIRVTPPWPANGGARGPRSFASRPRAGRPRSSRSSIPGPRPRRRGAGGLAR